jgi:ankyrin repeat protein
MNVTDGAGMTPLMWAACYNHPEHVKLLLQLGADVEEKDMDGKTCMDW